MKQMWLPVFDRPDAVPGDPAAVAPVKDEGGTPPAAVLPGQIALFGRVTHLLGDLYLAVEAGDFKRAGRLRRSLIEAESESRDARALAFVEELANDAFWEREPAVILGDWRRLDSRLPARSPARRWVRDAVVGRLVGPSGAGELATRVPDSLPLIANWLLAGTRAARGDGDGPSEAREIVRDALLAGWPLPPDAFEDMDVAEVLSEDFEPEWLACLGTLRHVWPCPPPGEADLDAVRGGSAEAAGAGGARRFWSCLKVVTHVHGDTALRLEARRQMKRLNSDLHALCMRQPSLAR